MHVFDLDFVWIDKKLFIMTYHDLSLLLLIDFN